MEHISSVCVILDEQSKVGEARRRAAAITGSAGFGETEGGKVSIVVTEAANNILKHAGKGEMILNRISSGGVNGIEIIALDKGEGMRNMQICLADGHSTAGSPGTGMGAMKRLSQTFDIYSAPKKGTAVLSRLWAKPAKHAPDDIGGVCAPLQGEEMSGDGWAYQRQDDRMAIIAIDGLGHGPVAAHAAAEAIRIFKDNASLPPLHIMQTVHGALLSTRGAAVAIAQIDLRQRHLRYAGVGNISATFFDGEKVRGIPSYNGTVGHQLHKMQEVSYNWPHRGWLVLHSDGLYNRWKLEDYPGLLLHHPSLIAGILYRDFQRGRDDAMAVVTLYNR